MTLRERIDEARATIADVLAAGGPACVTSSFQNEDMALTRLVREQLPEVPVLFLDTGYHFAETYEYRDRMAKEWGLNLVNLMPRQTVAEQESQFGILYQSAPDKCCGFRKVEPLFRAVAEYDIWFTGLRREQSPTRANLQPVDHFKLPAGKELRKVSPLAMWTHRDVWEYMKAHDIPMLPLYERGYTSIGCEPCTTPPASEADLRSGRWGGKKLECGIHIGAK
jgi:phosphoadenosine phosphosulfate reductase